MRARGNRGASETGRVCGQEWEAEYQEVKMRGGGWNAACVDWVLGHGRWVSGQGKWQFMFPRFEVFGYEFQRKSVT